MKRRAFLTMLGLAPIMPLAKPAEALAERRVVHCSVTYAGLMRSLSRDTLHIKARTSPAGAWIWGGKIQPAYAEVEGRGWPA